MPDALDRAVNKTREIGGFDNETTAPEAAEHMISTTVT
jgi:hypothetical protein